LIQTLLRLRQALTQRNDQALNGRSKSFNRRR
jgi:hypothetical protein